jgi:anti-sigma regulatory factor (Ser/Thr protein kinase)
MQTVYASSEIPQPGDIRAVRAAAARWLESAGVRGVVAETAVLVASELSTNAVRHARSRFETALAVEPDCVRVEVFDLDTRPPQPVLAGDDATGGRGLQIVAAVASDWGFRTEERDGVQGKVIWAEISISA